MQATRARSVTGGALLGAAALALAAAAPAPASDKVYTVANYPVDAVAENAVAAKRKALADGEQAAFRSLLKRLMPVTAYPRAGRFDGVQAAELIDSIKVRSERNSPTEYLGAYDFTFRAKSVRDLLRREGIPFTEAQAPPVTIIPIWRGGMSAAPAEQAAWVGNWKGLDLENALTPVRLASVHDDLGAGILARVVAGDARAMRDLGAEYDTELALVALAGHDPATGRLAVTLAGIDAVGPFVLSRQYRVDAADPGYTRELAAVVALRTIEGRWKAVNVRGSGAAAAGGGSDLLIAVEFRGMAEWQEISRKLSNTPGVEELDVAGLSARSARVTLRYAAGAERLADELAQRGLDLRDSSGSWVLSLR